MAEGSGVVGSLGAGAGTASGVTTGADAGGDAGDADDAGVMISATTAGSGAAWSGRSSATEPRT